VRDAWNEKALSQHCHHTGHQLFVCPREDLIQGRVLSNMERFALASQKKKRGHTMLPRSLSLAIGMQVLVTFNIQTDLDLANGARGSIVGIVLHPEEERCDDKVVSLKFPPLCVLVKMDHTRAPRFPGLPPDVVPIEPITRTMKLSLTTRSQNRSSSILSNETVQRTVKRQQLPIIGAYTFTDYRSQGQTISSTMIDIAKPPTGGDLSLFNIYVSLSRCKGRHTIRILWGFEKSMLFKTVDTQLLLEDERLQQLDVETRQGTEVVQRVEE